MRLLRLLYVELAGPRAKFEACCCCCSPPGPPSPDSPFMSDATSATPCHACSHSTDRLHHLASQPSLSLSGSRILLSDPAATGHVLQSAAVGGLPTSAEHAAAARCSPPGSCRHQLIRLHHQLLRTSSLGLASCMQLQVQLLQRLRRLLCRLLLPLFVGGNTLFLVRVGSEQHGTVR